METINQFKELVKTAKRITKKNDWCDYDAFIPLNSLMFANLGEHRTFIERAFRFEHECVRLHNDQFNAIIIKDSGFCLLIYPHPTLDIQDKILLIEGVTTREQLVEWAKGSDSIK